MEVLIPCDGKIERLMAIWSEIQKIAKENDVEITTDSDMSVDVAATEYSDIINIGERPFSKIGENAKLKKIIISDKISDNNASYTDRLKALKSAAHELGHLLSGHVKKGQGVALTDPSFVTKGILKILPDGTYQYKQQLSKEQMDLFNAYAIGELYADTFAMSFLENSGIPLEDLNNIIGGNDYIAQWGGSAYVDADGNQFFGLNPEAIANALPKNHPDYNSQYIRAREQWSKIQDTLEGAKKTGEKEGIKVEYDSDIIYSKENTCFNSIHGTYGDDILYGKDGNDKIYGYGGNDIFYGGNGMNLLYGGYGNDIFYGGDDRDIIWGTGGNDLLIGGKGNDELIGRFNDNSGHMIYQFSVGDGNDTVSVDKKRWVKGSDTIKFTDVNSDEIRYRRDGDDFILEYGNGDTIRLIYFFSGRDFQIDEIHFADGVVLKHDQLIALSNPHNRAPEVFMEQHDVTLNERDSWEFYLSTFLFRDPNYDQLSYKLTLADGSALPSWIHFDPITLKVTGDVMLDEIMSLGLKITATDPYGARAEQRFTFTINSANTAPIANGSLDDVTLNVGHSLDWAIPQDAFIDPDFKHGDQLTYELKMADGSELPDWISFDTTMGKIIGRPLDVASLNLVIKATDQAGLSAEQQLNLTVGANFITGNDLSNTLSGTSKDEVINGLDGNDKIYGYAGNDTLIGGKGNDRLEGGLGNDYYLFSKGDGIDEIVNYAADGKTAVDTVKFNDIQSTEASFYRQGNHLIIVYSKDFSDRIQLTNFFLSINYEMDKIQFMDKTYLADEIKVLVNSTTNALFGTTNNERINGTSKDDIIYGLAGNDQLFGLAGNDILIGGQGNDQLEGGLGDDTYIFHKGDGVDTVYDTKGNDKLVFSDINSTETTFERDKNNLIISYGTNDQVMVKDFFRNDLYKIESFEFADGVINHGEIQGLIDAQNNPLMAEATNFNEMVSLQGSIVNYDQFFVKESTVAPSMSQELHSLINAMATFDSASNKRDFMVTNEYSLTQPLLTSTY